MPGPLLPGDRRECLLEWQGRIEFKEQEMEGTMMVDLWDLVVGSQVELDEGVIAEIQAPTEDGQWIRVRYVIAPQNPELVDAEDVCSADEIRFVVSDQEPHVH